MKNRPSFYTPTGVVAAIVALLGVVVWTLFSGATPFSPGSLSVKARAQALGGVTSHAQLGADCAACHTLPWSAKTMADRCMACHVDVADQVRARSGLHGSLVAGASAVTCRPCHTEHNGPNGPLSFFDHSALPFKLTGKHSIAPCEGCHGAAQSVADLRDTPHECSACHAKDDPHGGRFGTQCGECHTTLGWAGATFDHKIFPVNHGREERVATCQTCHPASTKTYTCYGCHEHTLSNVLREHNGKTAAEIAGCVKCHAGGRGGD